jgi:hypothetical protein
MGSERIAPPLFTSALDGVEWSALGQCRFTPRKQPPVPVVQMPG